MPERQDVLSATLQTQFTEYGLIRALARQDISPGIARLPVPEAARILQHQFTPRGSSPHSRKTAKRAARFKKAKKAHKKKRTAQPSKGTAVVFTRQPRYWTRVTNELHLLICTNDKKYEALRKQLGAQSKTSQVTLVSIISSGIGAYIGLAGTIVGPFVMLGLIALLRVGKNAWCAGRME